MNEFLNSQDPFLKGVTPETQSRTTSHLRLLSEVETENQSRIYEQLPQVTYEFKG